MTRDEVQAIFDRDMPGWKLVAGQNIPTSDSFMIRAKKGSMTKTFVISKGKITAAQG